jgi:glycosyltransferase involved in cell wall biosynthesis
VLKVAADATPLLASPTGVGVFTSELLNHLAPRPDLDLYAYAVSWRGRDRLAAAVPEGTRVVSRPMAARPLHEMWRRADHPRIDSWIGRPDVVWGTNYVVPPTRAQGLVTVHDLTPVRFPELTDGHTGSFPTLIRRALRRGAHVHTVSESVRDEVIDEFGLTPDRVHAIHNGVRSQPGATVATGETAARITDRVGSDRYVLALGTVEPRKDLPTLVDAFELLADDDPDLRLVIAGADGWGADALTERISRCPHASRIVRRGWVEEAERPALLAAATVYAFPSLYEGFGLPALEAMQVGVPVVATAVGALPEVCGDAADLVPPRDPGALAGALRRCVEDETHRRELVRRGHINVDRFSWARSADAFADLFAALAAAA